MAKSRNNLLGVGGQRKKLSRADQQGNGPARNADRKAAEDQKQELLRKMRERASGQGEQQDDAAADDRADDEAAAQD
ncbi:DUF6243 family protein [Streptomyces sp. AK02-01A]|uniref:DUF6243 family protein n=1 Tax=Streptomyces sp. AK02-01A TaxID=3028648 RepID=UPI0029B3B9D2|nr:DUF6243 family protein [Streptomyces sp. AK02-01A]MDX3849416.1 DUF6243 family protein [Streptomyces sp. AK02-01A]